MTLINTLINYLNLLKFDTKKTGCQISKSSFKTADSILFRRIICYVINILGDFNDIVEKFDSPLTMGKMETLFRNSIKDIVVSINDYYPNEFKVKSISQSHLIAPQGVKIIDFLISLCSTVVQIKCKQAGISYIPPANFEEYELLMSDYDDTQVFEPPQKRLEMIEKEFHLLNDRENVVTNKYEDIRNTIVSCPFISHLVKNKAEQCINYDIINEWTEEVTHNLRIKQENMIELKNLHKCLSKIVFSINSLREIRRNITPLDGLEILNSLGFKSNISAEIDGVELIDNGKLNLISLLKITVVKATAFVDYIETHCSKTLCNTQDLAIEGDTAFMQSLNSLNEITSYVEDIDNELQPIINRYREEANEKTSSSLDEFHMKVKLFYQKVDSFIDGKYPECENLKPIQFPIIDENLQNWNFDDKKNNDNFDKNENRKISKFISLSSKKLPIEPPIEHKNKSKPLPSRSAMLLGLCSDRRATIASPSPRRERFRTRYRDNHRVPLKATSKTLFFSSSPLSLSASQKPSFAEVSAVDKEESLMVKKCSSVASEKDDSITTLALGCGFQLGKSLSEPSLNLTQEIDKWDILSDSDLNFSDHCSFNSPKNPNFNSFSDSPSTPQ